MKDALVKVAVHLILRNDAGGIFIMRRSNTGYMDGFYEVPSGHVDDNELPIEALIREALQECGIVIFRDDIVLALTQAYANHDGTSTYLNLFFVVEKWTGMPCIAEPEECDDAIWVDVDELPKNMIPHVRRALDCVESKIGYDELSLDWFKGQGCYRIVESAKV